MDKKSASHDANMVKKGASHDATLPVNRGIFPLWSNFTDVVRGFICHMLARLSVTAARYPKVTLISVPILSLALVAMAFFTNFELVMDPFLVFAPFGSAAVQNRQWVDNTGFTKKGFPFMVVIHGDGENIMGREGVKRLITAVDVVRKTPGYNEICASENDLDLQSCEILSVGGFWGQHMETFLQHVHSDEDVARALKREKFTNGFPVDLTAYIDTVSADEAAGRETIDSVKSYFLYIFFSDTNATKDFENDALDNILRLRKDWECENDIFSLEAYSVKISPEKEMNQAIINDLPLLPTVIAFMSIFTCMVFFRRDRVKSRTLLGIASVLTIGLSLMSGFGLMFLLGVPYTNMTTLLPFIIFGVGLDDTFIITGHFFQTQHIESLYDRLADTMSTVGMSVFVTTVTTSLAFILGLISNIPAVYWLCLYAFPTIIIDFIYQITFFTTILILDERRIQENRMDCCTCCGVSTTSDDCEEDIDVIPPVKSSMNNNVEADGSEYKSVQDRFMIWYSETLMYPGVKVSVILVFAGFLGFCIYSTTQLYQAFDPSDLAPEDSYIRTFMHVWKQHMGRAFPVTLYFRDVDQSNPEIQEQMRTYIRDIVAMPFMGKMPSMCWVTDWPEITSMLPNSMSFNDQLELFLSIPEAMKVYGQSIIRDKEGNIVASSCELYVQNMDDIFLMDSIKDQIKFLHNQRQVGFKQLSNEGLSPSNWSFFAYDPMFIMLEFYAVHVTELITTTIAGLAAVTSVSFFFLPHWSGVFFVLPIMMILNIDLVGWIQFSGLHMNVVTFVILVVSIGLLVDFILHILLCYYESKEKKREGKAKDALQTLGPSVLVGGMSTFFGVVLLAFSTSTVVQTVYICFLGMVVVGISHGLVLLPVLLSLFGPENIVGIPECDASNTSKNSGGILQIDTDKNTDNFLDDIDDSQSNNDIENVLFVDTDGDKDENKNNIFDNIDDTDTNGDAEKVSLVDTDGNKGAEKVPVIDANDEEDVEKLSRAYSW